MRNLPDTAKCQERLAKVLELVEDGFCHYLRNRHASDFTLRFYRCFLRRVARFTAAQGRDATDLRRSDIPWVMRGCLPGWQDASIRARRSGLRHWLKFIGHFEEPSSVVRWHSWLDDYMRFLQVDRGLADSTRRASLRIVGRFLTWRFDGHLLRWDSITPSDFCRYAAELRRSQRPRSINDALSILRQFFRFVHLGGACSVTLIQAIPTVADFGRQKRPALLDEGQRRRLLNAFNRKNAQGRRDYAMALCLLDLGLRAVEVSRLRLDDVCWSSKSLKTPLVKRGRGRELPLPGHVSRALLGYLKGRPKTKAERLFVGERLLCGRPLSSCAICAVMDRAYKRCGLQHLFGTHRLRHSFATRLFAGGCTTKEIADLLGHRLVATTDHYTQSDDLRRLAQPWPK